MTQPVVTISAPYGAGGSRVGPLVAEELGVTFVDRAIPVAVSQRLAVPVEDVVAEEESRERLLDRLVAATAPAAQMVAGAPIPMEAIHGHEAYVEATREVLRDHAARGAVILGRAGAVVLRDVPTALHVRLDGPLERRVAQAMRFGRLSPQTARRQLRDADRAREAYVRRWYDVDPRDADLYHLRIDSTALDLETCVQLIVAAARSRAAAVL